ncbi:2-keto-myo-inositol isomerase [Devosia sp. YR412]|uniref:TIM barrel protein n=1 Tax=Devosia sp. YR412 TaxID=1881030 RepID=UPI0008D61EAF|nr:TIM barrel protein [Devosia sp. YR412]SEQ10030.1 2-keto-myo-inositol isomerase [Devosia sp. YR412]
MTDWTPIQFAINQKTARNLPFEAFLDLAAELGCVGVEPRNDLGRPLFDGLSPWAAGELARSKGLRFVGLSEIYPFDDWSEGRLGEVARLLDIAEEARAETVSLIPRVDGRGPKGTGKVEHHRRVLEAIASRRPQGVTVLVEPIGFDACSIRRQSEVVAAIERMQDPSGFGILHDTFQHALAADTDFIVPHTGLVHISGVAANIKDLTEAHDAMRLLVDNADGTRVIEQIRELRRHGYAGAFSFEATLPAVCDAPDPLALLRGSMMYLRLTCEAAF